VVTEPGAGERRNVVIETFILGVERSTLRGVVASELLRTALDMEYDSLVVDGRIHLDVIWKTIENLPGFDLKNAEAPFCWFKTIENRLKLLVVMPKALEHLASAGRNAAAGLCLVKARELEHVLSGASGPLPEEITGPIVMPPTPTPRRLSPPPQTTQSRRAPVIPEPGWRSRRGVGVAAGVIALATAAWITFTFVKSCDGPARWKGIATMDLGLPVKNAKQLGNQVGATLTDPRWVTRPEADRRVQMEDALRRLRGRGVTVFFVSDESRPRASAQWSGGKVVVRFY
jgi:hypothetical protein